MKPRKKNIVKNKKSLFRESFSYLKESRKHIFLAAALFFISAIFAFIFPGNFVFFDELLKNIVAKIKGKGFFELIWFIFQNNASSAFFAIILGIFLGVFPIINALTNGAVLGYVFALSSTETGFRSLFYILPHGIFELPAIFIALGVGMRLGFFIFAQPGKRASEFKIRFTKSIKTFFSIVLPLLIIAAIIEGSFILFNG